MRAEKLGAKLAEALVAKVVSSTVSIGRLSVVMSRWAVGPSS